MTDVTCFCKFLWSIYGKHAMLSSSLVHPLRQHFSEYPLRFLWGWFPQNTPLKVLILFAFFFWNSKISWTYWLVSCKDNSLVLSGGKLALLYLYSGSDNISKLFIASSSGAEVETVERQEKKNPTLLKSSCSQKISCNTRILKSANYWKTSNHILNNKMAFESNICILTEIAVSSVFL